MPAKARKILGVDTWLSASPAPARGRRLKKTWTAAEMAIIKDHYVAQGSVALMALLPGRSAKSIYTKANNLGLRRQAPHGPVQDSTEYIDAAIRRHYRDVQPPGAMAALAKRLGVARQWVSTRAATLGVLPTTRPCMDWAPEEDALLEANSTKRADALAKMFRTRGYHRTASAIGQRLYTLGLDRFDPDVFTAWGLARCMRVDSHVPLRWIEKGGPKAKRVGAQGDHGRTQAWEIRRADLREFLIRSADWDHRRCPREWLVDILAGGRA